MAIVNKQDHVRSLELLAAAAITVGQLIYIDADGKWALADADAAGKCKATHVAVTPATASGKYCTGSEYADISGITPTGVVIAGSDAYLSTTAGGVATRAACGPIKHRVGRFIASTRVLFDFLPDGPTAGFATKFTQAPVMVAEGGVAWGANQGEVDNIIIPGDGSGNALGLSLWQSTAQTLKPVLAAGGLEIGCDLVQNEILEIGMGITARNPCAFVIGTSPAFYVKAGFKIASVANENPVCVGFRKSAAYAAGIASYTDYAAIGNVAGAIKTLTANDNTGTTQTATDTQNVWADTETHTLTVLVSAAGVVTYKIDDAAPTTVAAFTFDDTDTVVPFIYYKHTGSAPASILWTSFECGYQ